MDCCKKPHWVAELGIAICRHCGATKTIPTPYWNPPYVTPWIVPYPTTYPYGPIVYDVPTQGTSIGSTIGGVNGAIKVVYAN